MDGVLEHARGDGRGDARRLDAHRRPRLPHDEGYLFVTDRLKDMIVTGGENVYPREVEDVLFDHPGVLRGARSSACPTSGGASGSTPSSSPALARATEEELVALCRGRLAGYKCPKTVEFADGCRRT